MHNDDVHPVIPLGAVAADKLSYDGGRGGATGGAGGAGALGIYIHGCARVSTIPIHTHTQPITQHT